MPIYIRQYYAIMVPNNDILFDFDWLNPPIPQYIFETHQRASPKMLGVDLEFRAEAELLGTELRLGQLLEDIPILFEGLPRALKMDNSISLSVSTFLG